MSALLTVRTTHGRVDLKRAGLFGGCQAVPIVDRRLIAMMAVGDEDVAGGEQAVNLLDLRYRLAEFNYASDFRSAPAATLVPARHFAAGAPLGVFVSIGATVGGA